MAKLKTGDEMLRFKGEDTAYSISEFWRWSSSDLLNNTLRGAFAEFIVAAAMGINISAPREDWAAWDLTYTRENRKIRIEVKSSAYVQSWEQKKPSAISFSIRPARILDSEKGDSETAQRNSDVYVFCVYAEKDRKKADPLILDGWEFYIVPTAKLNEVCGNQEKIALSVLIKLNPIKTDFLGIKTAVLEGV